MQEGANLVLDTMGPFTVFCKPRMALTREANRTRRDTIKMYVLLSVCMYSHSVSAAVMAQRAKEAKQRRNKSTPCSLVLLLSLLEAEE